MSTITAEENTATKRVEEHLDRALDADGSTMRKYHIRTALQLLDTLEPIGDGGHASE